MIDLIEKMAAKSKKRLNNNNFKTNFDKLQLKDVICSICQSIFVEPVTLPCEHSFCQHCFNGSIENNALCCPLCRLRIGSWLRTTSKQNNFVNLRLWDLIKSKFQDEINVKLNGGDLRLEEEVPKLRLSAPGEIRSEYEAELKRIQNERFQQENKHQHETELLISKLRQEEEEENNKYLELLKQDELIAKSIQNKKVLLNEYNNKPSVNKLRLTKIDNFLKKQSILKQDSPLLTDDNSSIHSTSSKKTVTETPGSPELTPQYYRKNKTLIQIWNKSKQENQDAVINKKIEASTSSGSNCQDKPYEVSSTITSNIHLLKNIDKRKTDSVDSMNQELCHFKPINRVVQTSISQNLGLPIRVGPVRLKPSAVKPNSEPSREQYLESLCNLRGISLSQRLSSAFVLVNKILSKVQNPPKGSTLKQSPQKRTLLNRKQSLKSDSHQIENTAKLNETTPKKIKNKETPPSTDKKNCLRSSSKKLENAFMTKSPSIMQSPDKSKFEIVVKNLSSPLKNNCNVTKILEEQLRIERMIEQEKKDLELAQQVDAEINGGRKSRKPLVKRQSTLNYTLRPAKKFKV